MSDLSAEERAAARVEFARWQNAQVDPVAYQAYWAAGQAKIDAAWGALLAQRPANEDAAISYLGWVGSHERLSRLLLLWQGGYLSQPSLNRVLAEYWTTAGYPSETTAKTIVRMFTDAGYVTDRPGVTRPTEPVRVYRGGLAYGRRGVCWTTDQRVARFFAYRFGTAGRAVFSAVVPSHGILGQFFDRQEFEILVNPRTLREVTTLDMPAIAGEFAAGLAEGEREGPF